MNLEQFKESLSKAAPPENMGIYLLSLWYDANGNWNKAHEIIQDEEDETGSWIHAYLHRKEGDIGNADYWYRKAGRKRPDVIPEVEWKEIAFQLAG